MERVKTEAVNVDAVAPELSYEEKVANRNIIANRMASKTLTKKCYKLVSKAVHDKTFIRSGLKEVQTRIRKGETGIVLLAGDVKPIDVMCHMPIVCEDKNIPYVYVPSRKDLGAALGDKSGCIIVLIRPNANYKDQFEDVKNEIIHFEMVL